MSIPKIQKFRIASYLIKQMLLRRRRFPLVLMLEPSFRCNLRCSGCGKIAHPEDVLHTRLTREECISAVDECGAPVVSIPGGEPLLLADIHTIVQDLAARKKFVYLCTNALLVEKRLADFTPSPYLTFTIHLDGLREQHDSLVCRPGTFDRAVSAIEQLLSAGFRVTTNTTLFRGETPEDAARLFDFLTDLGVEGMTVTAAFCYTPTDTADAFLSRKETVDLFRELLARGRGKKWRFNHSRRYLQFLAGQKAYRCTPWGNPTRNIFGWQRPCYLLDDGYAASYRELMDTTDWGRYGASRDPRCTHCMVHSGFEPTAVLDTIQNPHHAVFTRLRQVSKGDPTR